MIIDYCIPKTFKRHAETLYKVRVLITIICVFFLINTCIVIWLQLSAPVSINGKLFGTTLCSTMQFGYFIAMLVLCIKGWFNVTAHFVIATTAIGIIGGITVSGGPILAPATSLNILPIIMAFVLTGKRSGLIWAQIILAIHTLLIIAAATEVPFIQTIPTDMLPIQHAAHWLITYSAMIGLMFVYDMLNASLRLERDEERMKFQHLASHDSLTDLANRLQFDINLSKSIERSDRNQRATALLYIDLNRFKPINDKLGHDMGDKVLKEVSQRLKNNVREADTVARLGGDEFGIILEDFSEQQQLTHTANKLQKMLTEPLHCLNEEQSISASIGIALYPDHTQNKEDLLKFADIAMYDSKGKNSTCSIFNKDMIEEKL